MGKSKESEAADIVAAARAEADRILKSAQLAADTEVAAAKEEVRALSLANKDTKPAQDQNKRHIKSVNVRAIRKGYANHRIYEVGSKFSFRYWSHTKVGDEWVPVSEEKALGSWMVPSTDPRYSKTAEELADVRVAESDSEDISTASVGKDDLNVI